MTNKSELWATAEELMRSFAPLYQSEMQEVILSTGAALNTWYGLALARGSDPAPFTVERYHAMFPYTAQASFAERLETLAGLELLERVGEGAYRLTDLGREGVEGVFEAAHRGLAALDSLPADEMAQLNKLLFRLVEATLEAPEPAEKWSMMYSRWTDPGDNGLGSVRTDQYLTDLVRYRDDAHLAAWKPYGVSGHVWESFTLIWRDQASTAEELAEQLEPRGHTAEEYAAALQELVARGWVSEEAGTYRLTEEGTRVREEAEEVTDRHFFVGWSALSEEELVQLSDLLTRAKESVRAAILKRLWGLATEASQAFVPATRDIVTPMFEKHGLDTPGYFYMVLSARRLEPDLISNVRLGIRAPYSNPIYFETLLSGVAEAGMLSPQGNGEYALTEQGCRALQESEDAFYRRLGELDVLPVEDLERVEGLLEKVGEASLEALEPASKWAITTTRRGHPSQEYPPLARIDQRLDDLGGFRDDAHLAAWQPYDVSGQAWEAFTFIWRGDASTAEELAEKLPFRGYSAEAYTEALEDLVGRGWVERTADGYRLTEKGSGVRQDAEDATDRIFFAPWACLDVNERNQLSDLLARLRDGLRNMGEADEETA
jgi:DNA-binding MarR family transcriptional regulator